MPIGRLAKLEADPAEEHKKKVKTTVMKLFTQLKVGCKKAVCFNPHCQKNPLGSVCNLTRV